METARDQVIAADGVLPIPGLPIGDGRIARTVLDNLLPRRRPRVAPRKVKCAISRYATPRDPSQITSVTIIGVAIAVESLPGQAPDGRRNRTLQLTRTDPRRSWRAREIATGLGLASAHSLRAELGRWVGEGILRRTAHGIYALVLQPEIMA